MPTMISFLVIKNHESQTLFSISNGRNGHLKKGDTSIGTFVT